MRGRHTSSPTYLTANPRPQPSAAIAAAVERLRRSEPRFRALRTDVRGGTVRVLTGDAPGEDVMAFAQAVRRLPGVERVVVQDTSPAGR